MTTEDNGVKDSQEPKPRRRLVWVIAAVVVVVAALAATAASLNRGPYSFLEKFHPKHIDIDYAKMMPAGYKPPGKVAIPKLKMLVFEYSDADAILKSLKAELTKARGYSAIDMTPKFTSMPKGAKVPDEWKNAQMWSFNHTVGGGLPPDQGEGALFLAGQFASEMKDMYTTGFAASITAPRPVTRPNSCILIVSHEDTWLERQLAAVKGFLHLQ
jgi:hypothetical protein